MKRNICMRKMAGVACVASFTIGVIAIAANSGFASPAHKSGSNASRAAAVAPRAALLVADKGKFRILANGKEAGQEEFEISQSGGDWLIHGIATIQTAQGATHIDGTLEVRPDGMPVRYQWSTDGSKKAAATVVFNGAAASIALNMANTQPYTQQLTFSSLPVAILDNNLYDQYAVLAGLYDWSKKGVQTFSVLVPQELTPGSVSVESLGKQDSDGKQMDELRVKTDDLEIDLFLDRGRLMRIAVPAAGAEVVRD